MKRLYAKGSTSIIVPVFIQDATAADGAGLAGLDHAAGIVGGYLRDGGSGVTLAVDEAVATPGTYQAPSSAGHARIGTPANMRSGVYELHLHNDLLAAGADGLIISLGGAANMADIVIEIQLTDIDLYDSVRAGLTALPNAAADAAGGLAISDAGGLDLDALAATAAAILNDTGTSGVLLAAGAMTAATIANDAFTAAHFADDCFTAAHFADDCFTAAMFAVELHVYAARLGYREDAGGEVDQYTALWFKDGVELAAASIASPTIQVIRRSSGADLIAQTAMEWDAADAMLKYDATDEERNINGEVVKVVVAATIDGATRTVSVLRHRDL
jgi:hypothetical protein